MLEANRLQLETEGVTVRDSTFNFNSFTCGYRQAPRRAVKFFHSKTFSAVSASRFGPGGILSTVV